MTGLSANAGFATINGARLYYEVSGRGRPVVLIHAGIADSRMWDEQVSPYAKFHQVIRYDVRGAGQSNNPDGSFSFFDDLLGLLDHLGIEKPVLVGVSMGGTTALDFALTNPTRLAGLITVGSTPSGYKFDTSSLSGELLRRLTELYSEMQTAESEGDISRLEELELQMWVDGPYRKPSQVNPRVRSKVRQMNHRSFELVNDKAIPTRLEPPAIGRLAEISVPALILAGALDVPNALAAADILASDIKNAQKATIPGTAHMPNMEKPAEFNWLVLDFLSQL